MGMPTRLPYKDLTDALSPVISRLPESLVKSTEQITLIACILWAFDVKNDLYKLGRTRVFFRAGQFELIDRILQSAKDGFGNKVEELVQKIHQAAGFRKQADKMVHDLNAVVETKQREVLAAHQKVGLAIEQINNAPVREIQVPPDLAELLLNCDRLLTMSKSLLEEATTKGNLTVTACNKVIDQLDSNGQALVKKITKDLDSINSRYVKVSSKHIRTMTRFDALLGHHDRVREVANSLEDVLVVTQGLLTKATSRIVEIQDGGRRCDLPYAEERAKSCEDIIQQIAFKLEGVELDLKEIFEVFGAESTRGY
jgi:hypothetical protein